MIIAVICFLFILSFVKNCRPHKVVMKAKDHLLNYMLAVGGFGLGYLLVYLACRLLGAELPTPIMMVLGTVPGGLCVLVSIWALTTDKPVERGSRLSEAETIAVIVLFSRYKAVIEANKTSMDTKVKECSPDHLINLCNEVLQDHAKYPFDKLSRWMAFTQGVLATQGLISVEVERDFSRPYLHAVHQYTPPTFSG